MTDRIGDSQDLMREFRVLDSTGSRELMDEVMKLKDTLNFITSSAFPSNDYGYDELRSLCESLVKRQRKDDGIKPGSWGIPADLSMPSDARVEFVFMPSYLAIAILVWTYVNHFELLKAVQPTPINTNQIPRPDAHAFEKALRIGLRFISYRNLAGHGYDADREMIKAIEILDKGGVFKFIRENPSMSVPLRDGIDKARERLMHLQQLQKTDDEICWSVVEPELISNTLTKLSDFHVSDVRDNQ